jgi:hypothetical protein
MNTMPGEIYPDEAQQALAEIERRHGQVVDLLNLPWWYWPAIGLLQVPLGVAVDLRKPVVIGVVVPVYVIGMLLANLVATMGSWRRARPRRDLVDPVGVLAILGFVGVVVGVSLGVAFSLRANGAGYPATWGLGAGAALLIIGGPFLSGFLRRRMLRHRGVDR